MKVDLPQPESAARPMTMGFSPGLSAMEMVLTAARREVSSLTWKVVGTKELVLRPMGDMCDAAEMGERSDTRPFCDTAACKQKEEGRRKSSQLSFSFSWRYQVPGQVHRNIKPLHGRSCYQAELMILLH